jgi:hypothetical protein
MGAGFAAVGFDCATLVPSALTAAAHLPGVTGPAGASLVTWLMRLGFLATPARQVRFRCGPVPGARSATLGPDRQWDRHREDGWQNREVLEVGWGCDCVESARSQRCMQAVWFAIRLGP